MTSPLFPFVALVSSLPALAAVPAGSGDAARARAITRSVTTVGVVLAVGAALALAWTGAPVVWRVGGAGAPWELALRFDAVAAGMVLLITGLGWTIGHFSIRYMAGDPREARFHRAMLATLTSVLMLAVAGNLLVFFMAWVATSATLHALLRHYPERAGATLAARKKFVISRLGDLCLVAAGVMLWRAYGTWDFEALFAAVAVAPGPVAIPALFLAAGAAVKSAQLPFHWWLPETMETPTPVSALMHAGIINAGGFLVIRLSPLFVHAPGALTLLTVLGGATAAFGAVVMLTQPSVKRALAYSTIAQMGFMMLECGVGAFGLAFLHLVAHSLYKAHAFLTSGSTVGTVPRAAVPLRGWALVAGVITAGGLVAALRATAGPATADGIFLVVLGSALAYGLARAWSVFHRSSHRVAVVAVAVAFAIASTALHHAALAALPTGPAPDAALVVAGACLFVVLFGVQVIVARADRYAWSRALYVHALNGFYLGTIAQRFFSQPARSAVLSS